jgi:hypothetical protein
VLGRSGALAPPNADVAYWENQLTSGIVTKEGLIVRMLLDARTFENDPDVGFVTKLLDNKIELGLYHAIQLGLDYTSPSEAIVTTVALSAAVTPDGISDAIALIGLTDHVFI